MEIDLNKLAKGILIFSLLLVMFFYKEGARLEQQKQAIEQERQEKEKTKQALLTCGSDAYMRLWYREEQRAREKFELEHKCASLRKMTFNEKMTLNEFIEQNNIPDAERLSAWLDFEEIKYCSNPPMLFHTHEIDQQYQDDINECHC